MQFVLKEKIHLLRETCVSRDAPAGHGGYVGEEELARLRNRQREGENGGRFGI